MNWFFRFITPEWVIAITIYPWVFYRKTLNKDEWNHEAIHLQQQKELFVIFFYILYLIEWILRLPFGNAYKNISFEREAYANQNNINYLKARKPFNFTSYVSNRRKIN